MTKTLKAYGEKNVKIITIESTTKKLHGTLIWIDKSTGKYYHVERSRHRGRTIESAALYDLTKEEFEAL